MADDEVIVTDPLEEELKSNPETNLIPAEPQLPVVADAQDPGDFIMPMVKGFLETAGTLELSDKEKDGLTKAIDDEDIEIRPDGLIFPGWHWCANRMDEVFGPGAWVLTPLSMPKFVKSTIYAPYALHIKGKFVGYAIGEQAYYPSNATMTYGDACEGAKSNALLRLCKPLIPGMRRMWNQRFIAEWKAKYAEAYKAGDRVLWRRKGTPPDGTDQFEFLDEMRKCKAYVGEKTYYEILKSLGFEKSNKVTNHKKRKEVLTIMRSKIGYNPYDKENN